MSKKIEVSFLLFSCFVFNLSEKIDNVAMTTYFLPIQAPIGQSNNCYNNANSNPSHFCILPPLETNPILSALILSNNLHLNPKIPGYNHFEHLPLNPYLALLLSHYGKYHPIYGKGRGLYGYTASNNYHNNKPFGAYKHYDDHNT